jgi:hypothetical protein
MRFDVLETAETQRERNRKTLLGVINSKRRNSLGMYFNSDNIKSGLRIGKSN